MEQLRAERIGTLYKNNKYYLFLGFLTKSGLYWELYPLLLSDNSTVSFFSGIVSPLSLAMTIPEKKETVELSDRSRGYNSQYNPDFVRKPRNR
jgi:hypothetical protein